MANNPFLEERLPIDIRSGAHYADDYSVNIVATSSGGEHRQLIHPFPARRFTIAYTLATADYWSRVLALYHRAHGKYAGFRVKCLDDYTTNNHTSSPTSTDQTLDLVSTGIYQLRKEYGAGGTPIARGLPERTIYKPVTSTTLVAVSDVTIPVSGYTVDTVTGQVTFAADKTYSITGITKASSAVLTIGTHTLAIGNAVHISAVGGMTQINAQRALITAVSATTITVAINSSAYSSYTSGGVVHTRPQAGESVKGGCQFDLPCRFDSVVGVEHISPTYSNSGSIEIIELLNP